MLTRACRLVAIIPVALLVLGGGSLGPTHAEEAGGADASDEPTKAPSSEGSDSTAEETAAPLVVVVRWDDAITPVTRSFLADAIDDATARGAAALAIELDTPGGLIDATRDIVTEFFESPIPIIVWVGPSGARAASAGTFITMAAHVAAMAPGTNIGAASPVTMGGGVSDSTMASKLFNDTAAFVRSIAEKRGRNVEWAEQAVRDAVSITENEALDLNVIDFVAQDLDEIFERADARTVETPAGELVLRLQEARVERKELGLRYRLLSYLANPNIAYILLMLGIYGVFFELSNPGSVLPGVVGVIFLILAFFSMQTLPMNLAGLLLIIVGLILFILEAQITSFGLLTIGGITSTILGAVMLFDSPEPALRVSLSVIIPITLVTSILFAVAIGLSVKTLRTKPTTGREGMVGLRGEVKTALSPQGTVEVHGELWRAICDEEVGEGEMVVVVNVEGLLLTVHRAHGPARSENA
jgi:membrane-bound serine protease (ClpP class)